MLRKHDHVGRARRRFWLPGRAVLMAALAIFPVVVVSSSALAQDSDLQPLLDRLNRLERDVKTLNLQVFRGQAPTTPPDLSSGSGDGGPAVARLDVRQTNLEQELRTLTGQVEEMTYRIDQINKRLDKLVSDVDYRLTALERGQTGATGSSSSAAAPVPGQGQAQAQGQGAGAPATTGMADQASTSPAPTPDGQSETLGTLSRRDLQSTAAPAAAGTQPQAQPAPQAAPQVASTPPAMATGELPAGTPKEQYDYARNLLVKAQYEQAAAALKTFIQDHPDDPLVSNARYWLGETYYVRGDYVDAAEVFLQGYQKDPKSEKAPGTLLKLGMSLTNLNKKTEACAAFDKLKSEYPKAVSGFQKLVATERQRAGCH